MTMAMLQRQEASDDGLGQSLRRRRIPSSEVLKSLRPPRFMRSNSSINSGLSSPTDSSFSSSSWTSEESLTEQLNTSGSSVQSNEAPTIGLTPSERIRRIRQNYPKQEVVTSLKPQKNTAINKEVPSEVVGTCKKPVEMYYDWQRNMMVPVPRKPIIHSDRVPSTNIPVTKSQHQALNPNSCKFVPRSPIYPENILKNDNSTRQMIRQPHTSAERSTSSHQGPTLAPLRAHQPYQPTISMKPLRLPRIKFRL